MSGTENKFITNVKDCRCVCSFRVCREDTDIERAFQEIP